MALICRRHGLLFIMTPRTGCTALGELLRADFGAEFLPSEDILGEDSKIAVQKKHSTLKQLIEHGVLSSNERRDLFAFATVRNPYDSLVSLYVKKAKTYQPLLEDAGSWVYRLNGYAEDMRFCASHSFDEWIDRHYNPRWTDRWLRRRRPSLYKKYVEGVDAILRFENLQEDFDGVLRQRGVTGEHNIPLVNRTDERRNSYHEYYSDRSRKIVGQIYRDDLRRFDYSF